MRKQESNKKASNHACNPHILIGIINLALSFSHDRYRRSSSPEEKGIKLATAPAKFQMGYAPITVTLTVLNPGSVSWTDPALASLSCVGGHLDKFLSRRNPSSRITSYTTPLGANFTGRVVTLAVRVYVVPRLRLDLT